MLPILVALALTVVGAVLVWGPGRGSGAADALGPGAGGGHSVSSPQSSPQSSREPSRLSPGGAAGGRGAAAPGPVRPEHVVVPALGVRAPVSPIRTRDGALDPPSDPSRIGWWSGGARPGSRTGAAVLTGHTVHTGGGAFDDLELLAAGDEVVVRSGRTRLTYAVESVEVLSKGQLARRSARLFGRAGAPRLVLVTCEDWDGNAYLSNVVVTARPTGA